MKALASAYLTVIPFASMLNASAMYADLQRHHPSMAAEQRRHHAGTAVVLGAVGGLIWPFGVPATYCMTGFYDMGLLFPGSAP